MIPITPHPEELTLMAEHAHHHHHGAVKTTGFHLKLKEGTQSLHDEAEAGDFQRRMVSGELKRDEFASFLTQMHHVHETLDPALEAAAASDERMASIFAPTHRRLDLLQQDLIDLGSEANEKPLPAIGDFVAFINDRSSNSPVSLIGALYVKEGATNGNKVIAKRLRDSMELGEDKAMGYLDPHGKDQRRCWNAFKDQLNELDLSEQEQEDCVAVARATFLMVMNASRELDERNAPTVG